MAVRCSYCPKMIDDDTGAGQLTKDQTMHLGHWCRGAPTGVVGTARANIEVPKGEVRYRIGDDPAYSLPGEGENGRTIPWIP